MAKRRHISQYGGVTMAIASAKSQQHQKRAKGMASIRHGVNKHKRINAYQASKISNVWHISSEKASAEKYISMKKRSGI